MSRLTVAQARLLLYKYVASGTPNPATWLQAINTAASRLFTSANWKGQRVFAYIRIYDNQITTPPEIESIDKVIAIDQTSPDQNEIVSIQSEWFQFSENGEGFQGIPPIGGTNILRLGDGYCTFRDVPHPQILEIKTETAETGSLVIKALDANLNPIWINGVEGITVDLATVSPTATFYISQVVHSIYQIVKPQTTGRIKLFSTSPYRKLIANYGPNETSPNYQRYRVVGNPGNSGVLFYCLCSRAFIPLLNDNDVIFPSNLNAIRYALQAVTYEDRQDSTRAQVAWNSAYEVLEQELAKYDTAATSPRIQVEQQGFLLPIKNLV